MEDPTCQWRDPSTGHVCGEYAELQIVPVTGHARKPKLSGVFAVLCTEHRVAFERRHGIQAV